MLPRAQEYGFDGVEIHVAHGYLLSQFLSCLFNAREDEYGGPLENRARLAVGCVASARSLAGPDYPVWVKVNSCDNRDDPTGARGGLGEDESAQVARWLVEAGASAVEVSGDWHSFTGRDNAKGPFFEDFGTRLAGCLDVPVVVTGGWRSPDVIQQRIAVDGIAGVGMCRPFICEPDLVNRWLSGDRTPSKCTACGFCGQRAGIPCAYR